MTRCAGVFDSHDQARLVGVDDFFLHESQGLVLHEKDGDKVFDYRIG